MAWKTLKYLMVSGIVLASVAYASRYAYFNYYMEYQAKNLVRDYLKDPQSAVFRNIDSRHQVFCGEVNSRNSFGGMVGFSRFIALPRDSRVFLEEEFESRNARGLFEQSWRLTCEPA
ncbi:MULTISPECIES: hypothetical protein [unclassified Pseudomonas]|uniref:hypothetical protein n=1 Tax=unclassified Pseudomonas TaxID=196821 RepID=UPI001CC0BAEC|nr:MULTISPECIES: hypothetical protein [unclassified Pseudomonas]